jgi:HIRAN domain/Domain of unknown function (DUF4429)
MDGYGIIVDFDGDLLQVEPTNKFAKSALGTSHMSITVGDIASVSIKPTSVLTNGHLDVACRDGHMYRLHFRRKQESSFQELRRSLIAASNGGSAETVVAASNAKPTVGPATEKSAVIKVDMPALDMLGQGGGYYGQRVAGESHHFRDLAHLAGPAASGERELTASLQREPGNRYDPNAVKVVIEGRLVGYLPREDAPAYQVPLQLIEQKGRLATCKARLWWSREYDDFLASVSLDLAEPAQIVPIVWPDTTGRSVVLPAERSYQIHGESEHMEVLTALMNRAYIPGKLAAYGTLHIVERTMPRSAHRVIVIRIEDNDIGELSKQMSAKFLPLIEPLEAAGIACYAELLLTGNVLAVEATAKLTPPEALPQDFVQYLQSELNS